VFVDIDMQPEHIVATRSTAIALVDVRANARRLEGPGLSCSGRPKSWPRIPGSPRPPGAPGQRTEAGVPGSAAAPRWAAEGRRREGLEEGNETPGTRTGAQKGGALERAFALVARRLTIELTRRRSIGVYPGARAVGAVR
jgi:hypothetical protein